MIVDAKELEELRRRAFAIAYRLLGSVAEAEDVVQEALLRLHRTEREGQSIESPAAWVATVTTRLGLDELRSARVRRQAYTGEWLPEPLLVDESRGPAETAELADSLSTAFLVVLETLSPEQRAAFLLHDVFDYPYGEVARILEVSEANARQLASRARRHVDERRPRFEASDERRDELAERFFAAVEEGDLAGLEQLLAAEVELHGDGGGKAPALARPLSGRTRVARALRAWAQVAARADVTFRQVVLNGQPGAITVTADGAIVSALTLDIADGEVVALRGVVNPDKLRHLGEVADAEQILARARAARDAD